MIFPLSLHNYRMDNLLEKWSKIIPNGTRMVTLEFKL
jgi:hypothetical protein